MIIIFIGVKPTYKAIKDEVHYITRGEVEWVLEHCSHCLTSRPNLSRAPLRPIRSNGVFDRVQIDLIDMQSTPDHDYKWILHAKDHFSKYSAAYPLRNKTAHEVALAMSRYIGSFGAPRIIQCDNGGEFMGEHLQLMERFNIEVRNGGPRRPNEQSLVEQGNGLLK